MISFVSPYYNENLNYLKKYLTEDEIDELNGQLNSCNNYNQTCVIELPVRYRLRNNKNTKEMIQLKKKFILYCNNYLVKGYLKQI